MTMRCYSPKPPNDYSFAGYGPGVALMSEDTNRSMQGRFDLWNLFYLTNPRIDTYLSGTVFDAAPHTLLVVDLLDDDRFGFLIEALRNGTLGGVAARLRNHPNFKHLSLTQELGQAWVDTMLERAGALEEKPEAVVAGNVVHVSFGR